jgi:hypothetical protein
MAEGSEWSRRCPEPEPKGIPQKSRGAEVPGLGWGWIVKLGGADIFQACEEAGDFGISSAKGAEHDEVLCQEILALFGNDHPITATSVNETPNIEGHARLPNTEG